MARIPDGELERLKGQVSLVRLIEAAGAKLNRQGKDWACRCPWHEGDDTPSCVITPATNLWHCFGCDAGGSVIDWVMRQHKVSFRHACELLAKEHPALAASGSPAAPAPHLSQGKLRTAQTFSLESGDQALLDQVIEFYHQTLKSSPEALQYLESRGLGNMELIERFRLGYANRTLAYRLAPKQYKAGAESRAALQRVGILRESGHEHLNGSIVVPLFQADESGDRHVVGAYGRKLLDNLRAGTPKHLYLPGPHRGVLNREGIEGAREVILCEALLDALTFWSAGYRNVTSCYGVHGLTDEILQALKSCGAKRVLIAFDRDEAGDRGAEVVAKQLQAVGLDVFRLLFPKGEDVNSYARAVKPPEKSLQYSAMTGQSLFYLGEQDLKHKILAIAEEEGVRQAAYALKVLQSQGELTIASTGKDPATGMLVTQQYRVEGPVMLCLTTTAIDVDEELVNRCLVLTINESREQTRAIQQRQRRSRTLDGLLATSEAGSIRELHRNAQRLLRPLAVVNPYAEQLTFLDDRTRTRRDHAKYLTLIEAIALIRQHQRTVRTADFAATQ